MRWSGEDQPPRSQEDAGRGRATLGRIADKYKAEADAARPAFEVEWKKYKE